MTLRHKLEIAGAILALLVTGVMFRSWLAEHDLRLKSEAETSATRSLSTSCRRTASPRQPQRRTATVPAMPRMLRRSLKCRS